MSIESIDLGRFPDGEQGDDARTAFDKVNRNLKALDESKQPFAPNLTALAELNGAVNRLPYFTGAGALSLAVLTQAARDFLAAPNHAQRQEALGFGTATLFDVLEGGQDRTRGRVIRSGDAGIAGYFDMRGTIFETGTPLDVAGMGYQVGFSQGKNIGIPGTQASPYGALTVIAPLPGIEGNQAIAATYQRIYRTGQKVFQQHASSQWRWSDWSENSIPIKTQHSADTTAGAVMQVGDAGWLTKYPPRFRNYQAVLTSGHFENEIRLDNPPAPDLATAGSSVLNLAMSHGGEQRLLFGRNAPRLFWSRRAAQSSGLEHRELVHSENFATFAESSAVTYKVQQTFNGQPLSKPGEYCAEFIVSSGHTNAGRVLFSQGSIYALAVAMGSSGGTTAMASFQWVERAGGELKSTPLALTYSGNVLAQGYVRLGASAPAIQLKKLTGSTPATAGAAVSIPHGLAVAKILAVEILIEYQPNQLIPVCTTGNAPGMGGYQIEWYLVTGGIQLVATQNNSASALSKPVRILITFEE